MSVRTRSHLVRSICGLLLLGAAIALVLAAGARAQKKVPGEPVDLNTATAAELGRVPGIGPARAKAIVQFRKKSGPFERVEDLLAIRGISSRKLEAIRPYLTLSRPAPQKPAAH